MYALKIFTDTRICHREINLLAGAAAESRSEKRGELHRKSEDAAGESSIIYSFPVHGKTCIGD